jgi:hypothetical protein
VALDADVNEQAAIQAHFIRTVTADLLGRHAGPQDGAGFSIGYQASDYGRPPDLTIGNGRYYVDGLLVQAQRPVQLDPVPAQPAPTSEAPSPEGPADQPTPPWTYWTQPHGYRDAGRDGDPLPAPPFLAYLQVCERLVTVVEDPGIRETALGAALPDTTARLQLVWQVMAVPGTDLHLPGEPEPDDLQTAFDAWAAQRRQPTARLAVRAQRPARADEDPCIVRPDARYRGPENQLYRVEVHAGTGPGGGSPTFKWSRDNGSVVFPIAALEGVWVTLAALGRDDELDLHVGDWTEVVDDAYLAWGEPAPLLQVTEIDVAARQVRLSAEPGAGVGRLLERHPYLRRWDHRLPGTRGAPRLVGGALEIIEGTWIDLEDGVQVWFPAGGTYRPGDYWITAARAVIGDVEWPRDGSGRPLLAPPAGPEVHYAPLAWISPGGQALDLRQLFRPLA